MFLKKRIVWSHYTGTENTTFGTQNVAFWKGLHRDLQGYLGWCNIIPFGQNCHHFFLGGERMNVSDGDFWVQ